MNHYIEINISPLGPKSLKIPVRVSKVMQFLHQSFVFAGVGKFAVSFPHYKGSLGSVIRVHGTEDCLKKLPLFALDVKGVSYTSIKPIPDGVLQHVSVSRVQPNKGNAKLKRAMETGHITDPRPYIANMCRESLDLPFITIESASSNQFYKRFVDQKVSYPSEGEFDSFGMSKSATVPMF